MNISTSVRYIALYATLVKQYVMSRMSYRADFLISLIGIAAPNLFTVYTLSVIFDSISNLGGWTYNEVLFLYGFVVLSYVPTSLFAEHLWSMGTEITSGNFIRLKLRPINTLVYYLSQKININSISQFITGILIIYMSFLGDEMNLDLADLPLYLFAYICSAITTFSLLLLTSSLGFWISIPTAAMHLFTKTREVSNYPVTIFNDVLRHLFTFVLPMSFIGHYPASIILGKADSGIVTLFTPLVSIICLVASYQIWMYGARKYDGTGS